MGGDEVPAIAINRAGSQFAVVWDDDLGQTTGGNEDSIRGSSRAAASFVSTAATSTSSTALRTSHIRPATTSWPSGRNSSRHSAPIRSMGRSMAAASSRSTRSAHTNDTTMPNVVGLQSGNFLVVWSDGGFNGGYDVLGQLFSVDGAKIGSEFVVSDFSSSTSRGSRRSELLDGRVLVTWDPNKLNANVGTDAFARIVDPRQGAANWLGTSADEQYVGTGFADVMNGAGGNDRLWGEGAADQMTGGTGNDIFYVNEAGDKTFEAAGQGFDRILTTASYALAAGQYIEALATTSVAGTAAISLTGNELAQRIDGNNGVNVLIGNGGNDVLFGNGGNDTLIGGAGSDTLIGGLGNDIYVLENGADAIVDTGGVDTVTSTISRSIAPSRPSRT